MSTMQQSPLKYSPWGAVQTCDQIADGIYWVSTASHGGAYVDRALWLTMPEHIRETTFSDGGFFEEDCDFLLVFHYFEQRLRAFGDSFALRLLDSGKIIPALQQWHAERLPIVPESFVS